MVSVFLLTAEPFKWTGVYTDFAYPVLIFLLVSLTDFSFSLLPLEPLSSWSPLIFLANTVQWVISVLFLFDLFLAFDADTYLYGILTLTFVILTCFLFSLPCWGSLVFFLFPFLKSLPCLGLSLDFNVLYKKRLNVNFIFKSGPIQTSNVHRVLVGPFSFVMKSRSVKEDRVCTLPWARRKRMGTEGDRLTLNTCHVPVLSAFTPCFIEILLWDWL